MIIECDAYPGEEYGEPYYIIAAAAFGGVIAAIQQEMSSTLKLPLGMDSSEIERVVDRIGKKLKQNFCGVFAADELKRGFMPCANVVGKSAKGKLLPYAIINTDDRANGGQHWFTLIRLQERGNFYLFDSFGKSGFTEYVVSDDEEIIESIIMNYHEVQRLGFRYYSFDFIADMYLDLVHSNKYSRLSSAAKGIFNFFLAFAIAFNLNKIKITGSVDQFQSEVTGTCGAFSLYFLKHLFYNDNVFLCEQSKCTVAVIKEVIRLHFHSELTSGKKATELNERLIEEFIDKYHIRGDFY